MDSLFFTSPELSKNITFARILTPNFTFLALVKPQSTKVLIVIVFLGSITFFLI